MITISSTGCKVTCLGNTARVLLAWFGGGSALLVCLVLLWWLSAGSVSAQEHEAETIFSPDVDIFIPQLDANNDGVNDFSGTRFEVSFTPNFRRTDVRCSMSASETHVVGDNGSVSLDGQLAQLLREPVVQDQITDEWLALFFRLSGTSECSYTVSVTEQERFLLQVQVPVGSRAPISHGSTGVRFDYEIYEPSYFNLQNSLNFTVSQIDANSDGNNDFSGQSIVVSYSVSDTIPVNARNWCTVSATETYMVRDNGTITLEGTAAQFIGPLPADAPFQGRCSYNMEIPIRTGQLVMRPNLGRSTPRFWPVPAGNSLIQTFTGSNPSRTFSYISPTETYRSDTNFIIPQTDSNGDGVNDHSGTRIRVNYEYLANTDDVYPLECTQEDVDVYVVQDNGTVTLEEPAALLTYAQPTEAATDPASQFRDPPHYLECSYSKKILYNREGNLVLDWSFDARLTSRTAFGYRNGHYPNGRNYIGIEIYPLNRGVDTLKYLGYSLSESFNPNVSISVDWSDDDDNNIHDLSGERITVRYNLTRKDLSFSSIANRVASSGCSQGITEVFVVQANGKVVLDGQAASLRRVGTDNVACIYDVSVPEELERDVISSIVTFTIPGVRSVYNFAPLLLENSCPRYDGITKLCRNPAIDLRYELWNPTLFSPELDITVPQTDANGDGINDFAGTVFVVSYVWNPDTGTLRGCRISGGYRNGLSRYVVRNDGSVTTTTASNPVLVDRPPKASSACAYLIRWPELPGLALQEEATYAVRASSGTATAVYEASSTFFKPSVSIEFPRVDANNDGENDYGDRVGIGLRRVAGSHFRCTVSGTIVILIRGEGEANAILHRTTLVDKPLGAITRCVYGVTWPMFAGLEIQPGATTTVQATAGSASATYVEIAPGTASTFTPVVDITAPQIDVDGNGNNDYAGTEFRVAFERVAGSNVGCIEYRDRSFIVQNNGEVVLSGSELELVNQPAGVTVRCVYSVSWPSVPGLLLQSSATTTVQAASRAATATYVEAAATMFKPQISITIPQIDADGNGENDFANGRINVAFRPVAGSDDGCSASRYAFYIIQANGQLERNEHGIWLVNRPEGVTASCVYTVRWTRPVGLVVQSGATATVTALSKEVSGVLVENSATFFSPNVNITISQTDRDGDGVNDFSGQKINVSFRRVLGSNSNCNSLITRAYEVRDNGTVTPFNTTPRLIDRPAGATTGCVYAVSWQRIAGFERQPGATVTVSAVDSTASASYVARPVVPFSPTIHITVPPQDSNRDGENDFTGTSFVVTFRRVFGSNTYCTDSASATYEVQASGSVALSGPEPSLVDIPAGATTKCTYVIAWPTVAGLVRQPGATITVSESFSFARASYAATSTTFFSMDVNISVPQLDADGNRVNDLAGTSFVFSFRRVLGSNAGCTNSASGTYVVQANGSVTGLDPRLVDRPAGVPTSCEYDMTVPSIAGLRLTTIPFPDPRSASTYIVNASYSVRPATHFRPNVNISVPQLDADGNGVNDFAGSRFVVVFRRVSGSHSGCSISLNRAYVVQNGGAVLGLDPSLVDLPAGMTSGCSYEITWPVVAGLERQSGATSSVSASAKDVAASYEVSTDTTFSPDVTITVPQVDGDGNGVNDFAGTQFVVLFRRVFGSDAGCTASVSRTYIVQNSGAVTGLDPSLVDRPAGVATSCSYAITWPTAAGLVRRPGATISVGASARVASASYRAAVNTTFSPIVAINVPQIDSDGNGVNDFAGTSFSVVFWQVLGSDDSCTVTAIETYVVQNNGRVSGSNPSLVDRPDGVVAGCSYGITWPTAEGLVRQAGATATVSAAARVASAVYRATAATSFAPDVSITVPQVDSDGNGANDFAGTRFVVTFRRVFGSDNGCTASAIRTYTVQSSGTVTGSDPSLVDRPSGVTVGCSYAITWPTAGGLVRLSGATSTVSSAARAARVSYRATAATSFAPDVSITVPQTDSDGNGANDFAGVSFVVTFRRVFGSDNGCTASAIRTYTVQSSGTVTGSDPSLVDRPSGVTVGCSYAVTWPTAAGLIRLPGSTATVSSAAKGASAVYRATAATSFAPDVSITVPQTDSDGNGANDFAGVSFVVTFRRVFGSDNGCTASASRTYTVQSSGTVTGSDPSLVDRPSGVTVGCSYAVTWPTAAGLIRLPGSTATVSSAAKGASAVYRATAATSFAPDVSITVPQTDSDGNGSNDFAGVGFVVTFRRVFGSDNGCTASAIRTYTVQSSGTVTGSDPSLVDRPSGVTVGCSYAITWPTAAGLIRLSGSTATVSSAARGASAIYVIDPSYVTPGTETEEPEAEAPGQEVIVPEPEGDTTGTQSQDDDSGGGASGAGGASGEGSSAAGGNAVGGASGSGSGAGTGSGSGPASGVGAGSDAGVNSGAGAGSGSGSGLDETEDETRSDANAAEDEAVPGVPVPEVGVIQLSRGWVMLPFNGPSGMAPDDFASAMGDSINSVWVWDMSAQQWKGWTASRGSLGLTSLVPGDVVMVYAPTGGVVVYSPADLLGHRVGVNSWTLAPTGISLVVFGGGSAVSASDVFASYANSAVVVYLWDSRNQRWEYHLPGRQPLTSVSVPWFSDINPGDAMFVYNISPTAVTIPWQ